MTALTQRVAIDSLTRERKAIGLYELELIPKDILNKYERENIEINHELQRIFKKTIKELWKEETK